MGIYRNGVKNSYSEPVINLGICNICPKIKVSPSALEFRNLSYLVGELRTDGPGTVKMRFPVVTEKMKYLLLPNVCYVYIPYAIVEAIPDEKAQFLGWKLGDTGKIEQNRTLCFSPEDEYGDILVFTACFK